MLDLQGLCLLAASPCCFPYGGTPRQSPQGDFWWGYICFCREPGANLGTHAAVTGSFFVQPHTPRQSVPGNGNTALCLANLGPWEAFLRLWRSPAQELGPENPFPSHGLASSMRGVPVLLEFGLKIHNC